MSKQIEAMNLALEALTAVQRTKSATHELVMCEAPEISAERERLRTRLSEAVSNEQIFRLRAEEALREALAEQPAQQEPVKWSDYEPDGMHHNKPAQQPVAFDVVCDDCGGSGNDRKNNNYRCAVCNGLGYSEKMLYTSPQAQPAREPLTAKEIAEFVGTHEYGPEQLKWFRLGEAAHGITKGTK